MSTQRYLSLVIGHLNVPVGKILTTEQLALALKAGSVTPLSNHPSAAALVSGLFQDTTPDLILRAAAEANVPITQVNKLYQEALADHRPRVPAWERAIEYLV